METHPLTPDRWSDFESLMGPKGGYGGCWCMLWRQSKNDHDANAGDPNRYAMRFLVEDNTPPGLLAYVDGAPAGWISIAPRSSFPRLERSRVLKPVDDSEVWSVSCFLIAKTHRRRGVAVHLLRSACTFARDRDATIVEGYPIDPASSPYPSTFAWTGFVEVFEKAGFREVARRSPTRPIMRLEM